MLTEKQLSALRHLYAAKGDVLQAAMAEQMVGRGIDEDQAREAARLCANKLWSNAVLVGAPATIILGTLFTPVVGAVTGSSAATLAGYLTFFYSDACAKVSDTDLSAAVDRLTSDY